AELRWDGLRFPLCLRGRRSGDRIRTPGGTKTLKKLLIERRVPRPLRPAVPLLADAHGALVWVADLAVAEGLRPYPGDDALLLRLSDA
ncbi:MAG: tRNA lysidine(34) synthetase TilS, partial [Gemmatimonadota bacterium]|nr:tRNA lysidine(34) synthetase TilS [Gemmatimonadota bacterium]